MRVLKFGGSSVGTPERVSGVIDILSEYQTKGKKFAVVFSAFQGVTDTLISISNKAVVRDETYLKDIEKLTELHKNAVEYLTSDKLREQSKKNVTVLLDELKEIVHGVYLVKELTLRSLDYIMSFGERLSCTIITDGMNSRGLESEYLDSRILVKADESFGNAKVQLGKTYENIRNYFSERNKIQVVTGFIASTEKNETITLGRGGSDYTASIFGAALEAEEIEIWTDVDGILTADPRKVADAFSLPAVTYEEAMELSHFGAKVIHPPTMKPALDKKIKIRIKKYPNSNLRLYNLPFGFLA